MVDLALGSNGGGTRQDPVVDATGPSDGCGEAASCVHEVAEAGCTNAMGLEGRQ